MAAIKGTNGDDTLIGTNQADRFTPLLGMDYVDGQGGVDTLVVDYSSPSIRVGFDSADIFTNGSEIVGSFTAGDGIHGIFFERVEKISAYLGPGDGGLAVDGAAFALGLSLDVDAGLGYDLLQLDLAELPGDVVLEVKPNGKVHSNLGSFAGFEAYELSLGSGNHSITTGDRDDIVGSQLGQAVINTGAGEDVIYSGRSVDTVDGGDDYDYWFGFYQNETASLTFTFDGSAATLSNGTTISNVEQFELNTGSGDDQILLEAAIDGSAENIYLSTGDGNDSFLLSGSLSSILFSGNGWDDATIDFSHVLANAEVEIWGGEGALWGNVVSGADAAVWFGAIEQVAVALGDGSSNVSVGDLGQGSGGSLFIDAGGGFDMLAISLADIGEAVFEADESGNATSNAGASFAGFESYAVTGGEGDDLISTGAGDDWIQSGGGSDVLHGGGGSDVMFGGDGDDVITGGEGMDLMWGDAGADMFVFTNSAEPWTSDAIVDFVSADGDLIDLSAIDANANTAGDQVFTFIGGDAFSGAAGELRFEELSPGQMMAQGDMDGDGIAELWINVQTTVNLSASDFFL